MSEKRFIQEPISVEWDKPPTLSKTPHCPDRFNWRGDQYTVIELLAEWMVTERHGNLSRNMRPENLARAAERGSRGVGEFHYRVRAEPGQRVFELYFDRRDRAWTISAELREDGQP